MGQYCDSQQLERYWYNWIVSSSTPELDIFRKLGILWTRIIGCTQSGKPSPDPSYPIRKHCLLLERPLFFFSDHGVISQECYCIAPDSPNIITTKFDSNLFQKATTFQPTSASANEFSEMLQRLGYINEPPIDVSWHRMLENIKNICSGISIKFRLSEDEQLDLAADAFIQVINKLISGRLVYIPNKAPVFNLLTTTIYRIMFSLINKKNNQKQGLRKLLDDAAAGTLLHTGRSVRIHAPIKTH